MKFCSWTPPQRRRIEGDLDPISDAVNGTIGFMRQEMNKFGKAQSKSSNFWHFGLKVRIGI